MAHHEKKITCQRHKEHVLQRRKVNSALALFLVALTGVIAYSNTFHVPFQFDDWGTMIENPVVKDAENFTSSLKGFHYMPRRYLGFLTFALNYRLSKLDVTGYHAVNLLIHLTNSILVYFLVILTFGTPYFRGQHSAARSKKSEISSEKTKTGREIANGSAVVSRYAFLTASGLPFAIDGPRFFIAFFSALFFVSHPVQTQAVTYIIQRFASLATLFYLASVVFYVKGRLLSEMVRVSKRESMDAKNGTTRGQLPVPLLSGLWPIAYYFFSLVSAICAMMTKEIAFTLPLMILLYEFTFFRVGLKKSLRFLMPVLLILLIFGAVILHTDRPLGDLLSDLSEKARLQTSTPRDIYLMTEMRVIVTYIRLLLLPVNQNLDYDYQMERSFFTLSVLLSFLPLSALLGTALYLLFRPRQGADVRPEAAGSGHEEKTKEQRVGVSPSPSVSSLSRVYLPTDHAYYRLIAFGILWFFLALSVESSVIPIVDVIFEHRLYLPSVGAFIALSATLFSAAGKMERRWPRAGKTLIPIAFIVVILFSAMTFARNRIWLDERSLWEDIVRKSPGKARGYNSLGLVHQENNQYEKAIDTYGKAIALNPVYWEAYSNRGLAYSETGQFDRAVSDFDKAIALNPRSFEAYNNKGKVYGQTGSFDKAIEQFSKAIDIKSDFSLAYGNRGLAYSLTGDFERALRDLDMAIEFDERYAEAYSNRGNIYLRTGNTELAVSDFQKACDLGSRSACDVLKLPVR